MENLKGSSFFRKVDEGIFEKIDKFKLTTNYNQIQDFYNSLEEEQQKIFKAFIVFLIFLVPAIIVTFMWWQNNFLHQNLVLRNSIINKANQVIGQSQGLQEIIPRVFSTNPIDGQSMMTSRISAILSSTGVDTSKIQVSNFNSSPVSSGVMKSDAKFSFNNFSNDELMNMLMTMISREKFRISQLDIRRNTDTNLLQGNFQAIHYSSILPEGQSED